jgi:hypothetical protein
MQVETLQSVVAQQEQQLLQLASSRASETDAQPPPDHAAVLALLPKWRSQALLQHQGKLETEEALRKSENKWKAEVARLKEQLQVAETCMEVCCQTLNSQELRQFEMGWWVPYRTNDNSDDFTVEIPCVVKIALGKLKWLV